MNEQYRAATAALFELGDSDLVSEAARRLAGTTNLPSNAGLLDGGQLESQSFSDSVSKIAIRIVRRTNSELHALVCGDADTDSEDRQRIRDAFHLGNDAFASSLVAAGIAYCGLSPALAVVIAVILVKRIGRPVLQELCEAWGESMA